MEGWGAGTQSLQIGGNGNTSSASRRPLSSADLHLTALAKETTKTETENVAWP
jgi:hypothetical protein